MVEAEDVNGVGDVDVNKLKDLEVVEIFRELNEASKKKNKRSEAYAVKIKFLYFVVSLMIDMYLVVKCNYSL